MDSLYQDNQADVIDYMAHLLAFNVLPLPKDLTIIFILI